MFSTLFNYSLIIGNCGGRLVSNSARCPDRVNTFGEVQKAFSTNATLFLSSLRHKFYEGLGSTDMFFRRFVIFGGHLLTQGAVKLK